MPHLRDFGGRRCRRGPVPITAAGQSRVGQSVLEGAHRFLEIGDACLKVRGVGARHLVPQAHIDRAELTATTAAIKAATIVAMAAITAALTVSLRLGGGTPHCFPRLRIPVQHQQDPGWWSMCVVR